ncbi:MAG: hypothetical protein FJZ01_10140 [Candidatus Sericytochromatia bacterium]|nr:hypothetical protein [Candidatus Tanganyikabacteria bacterium]
MITRHKLLVPAFFALAALVGPGCDPSALLAGLAAAGTGLPVDKPADIPADFSGDATVTFSGVTSGMNLPTTKSFTDLAWAVTIKDGKTTHAVAGTIDGDTSITMAMVLTGDLKAGKEFSINTASSQKDGEATLALAFQGSSGSTSVVAQSGKVKFDSVEGVLLKYADAAKVKFSVSNAKCDVATTNGTTAATGSATLAVSGTAAARRINL